MKRIFKNIALMACAGLMLNACDLDEFNPSAGDASLTSFDAWSGLHSYSYSCLNDELYTAMDWLYLAEGGTDLWVAKQTEPTISSYLITKTQHPTTIHSKKCGNSVIR